MDRLFAGAKAVTSRFSSKHAKPQEDGAPNGAVPVTQGDDSEGGTFFSGKMIAAFEGEAASRFSFRVAKNSLVFVAEKDAAQVHVRYFADTFRYIVIN